MEVSFNDELQLLEGALRSGGFRFILISHNHPSVYRDIKSWITDHWAATRKIEEFVFEGKSAGEIKDSITQFQSGILLLRDTDVLFRDSYTELCTYFNQRRDFFAKYDIAYIAFIQPSSFPKVAHHLPDWWSLRSLELEFVREGGGKVRQPIEVSEENISMVYTNHSIHEKNELIKNLEYQLNIASDENLDLKSNLHSQLAELFYLISDYNMAEYHLNKFLNISLVTEDKLKKGMALNNIGQVYQERGEYDKALHCLTDSLAIMQEIRNLAGEGITLNNISHVYNAKGDYETALRYLEQSLEIRRQAGDKAGESTTLSNLAGIAREKGDFDIALGYLTNSLNILQQVGDRHRLGAILNNISQIHFAKGDYEVALHYLADSLTIRQQIGDRAGESATLNNISALYWETKRDAVRAIPLLLQSLQILQQIGSPNTQKTKDYLAKIKAEIGEDRYREITGE